MNLILKSLKILPVISALILTETTANQLAPRVPQRIRTAANIVVKAAPSKVLSPISALFMQRLAANKPVAFYSLCSCIFGSVQFLDKSGRAVPQRPYIHTPQSKNAFFEIKEPDFEDDDDITLISCGAVPFRYTENGNLELAPCGMFERKAFQHTKTPAITRASEIQITFVNPWIDISSFHTVPRSDSNQQVCVYNLVTNPKNKLDRTIIFGSQDTQDKSPKILRVTQVGLGANRLKRSTDPVTKAWLEFLTTQHTSLMPPENIPAIVASAYPALKVQSKNVRNNQAPISRDKLEKAKIMIDFFKSQGFPFANIVKQTGLSRSKILSIIKTTKK